MSTAPAAPTVTIADHNGIVLAGDLVSGMVTAKVNVDPSAKSARITITDNGVLVTLTLNSDGSVVSSNSALATGGYYNGVVTLYITPPGTGNSITISATQTNQANQSSDSGFDSTIQSVKPLSAPVVVIDDHNGSILSSDITNGTITAKVNVDPSIKSANVTVTIDGTPVMLVLHSDGSVTSSSPLASGGYYNGVISLTIAAPGDGKSVTVTATQTDQQDHVSGPGQDSSIEHLSNLPAPVVVINDHDGSILASDITYGTITAKVNVDPSIKSANVTVTIDGTPVLLTLHNDGSVTSSNSALASGGYYNGVISLTIAAPGDGKSVTVTATQTDYQNHVSEPGQDSSKEYLSSSPIVTSVEVGQPGVGDDTVTEGTNLVYNVKLSSSTSSPTQFSYHFIEDRGLAGPDDHGAPTFSNGITYDAATNTIAIPAGVSAFTVTVPTIDDYIREVLEPLVVYIGGDTGGAAGSGYILDNGHQATITSVEVRQPGAGDDTVTEGTALVYNVTLSHAATTTASFSYALGGETASANDIGAATFSNGVTYNAFTHLLDVPAGVTVFTVTVPTIDDTAIEATETLPLTIGGVKGTGYILDNEVCPCPTIQSIEVGQFGPADDTVTEGTHLVYNVTLSNSSSTPTVFAYALDQDTSTADAHDIGTPTFSNGVTYNPDTNSISVPAGVTAFSVTVPTVDDTAIESNETLLLSIGGKTATGVIHDNDYVPIVPTIQSVEVGQPGAGDDTVTEGTSLVYTVTLTSAPTVPTQYVYDLGHGTSMATSPDDYSAATFSNGVTYNAATHMVTVPVGVTAFTVSVPTVNDTVSEPTETLQLSVGGVTGTGSILDNDAAPTVHSVEVGQYGPADDSVTEGTNLVYNVTLNGVSSTPTSFSYTLGDGSTSPEDIGAVTFSNGVTYNPVTHMVIVPAGVTAFTVAVPTIDDTLIEATETLPLTIGGVTGTGTVLDNDHAPTIVTSVEVGQPGVADDTVTEGTNLVYNVTLSNTTSSPTEFNYFYGIGRGLAGPEDHGAPTFSNGVTYNATTQKITVPAGVNGFTVTVPTIDDYVRETIEALPLIVGSAQGNGYILDNGHQATITSVEVGQYGPADDTVTEGTALVYTVTLSHAAATTASFSYTLGGETASVNDIGVATFSNGVTFNGLTLMLDVPAGVTAFTVTVPTIDDTLIEATETLPLTIGGVKGTGYILDNDTTMTGYAKGLEDTPLTLTWAEFNVESGITGANLGIAMNSLPAHGTLTLNGTTVSVGQIVSKADIDAGHLIFKPALNESGEDQYLAPGVGNKLNDYAVFDYKVSQGGITYGANGHFTVDIAPIAEPNVETTAVLVASHALLPGIGAGLENGLGGGWDAWSFNQAYVSTDTDGSERTLIAIQTDITDHELFAYYKQMVAVMDPDGVTAHLLTPDSNGLYWIKPTDTVYISTVTSPNHPAFYSGIHYQEHRQEVNAFGTLLDEVVGPVIVIGNCPSSPLVLDLNGDGVHTLDMAHGVQFDLLNQGKVQTGWTDQHDGLLVLDLNHDGQINSGAELFGEATKLTDGSTAKDGFMALTQYDSNHDDKIDTQDGIFSQLKVWVDANSDGVTQNGELLTLAQAGVASLSLASQASTVTDNGNLLGLIGSYTGSDGAQHQMDDVWFTNNGLIVGATVQATAAVFDTATTIATTAVQVNPLAAYVSAHQSLDTLLANAGLSEAPVVAVSKAASVPTANDVAMEAKMLDAALLTVMHHELMA